MFSTDAGMAKAEFGSSFTEFCTAGHAIVGTAAVVDSFLSWLCKQLVSVAALRISYAKLF